MAFVNLLMTIPYVVGPSESVLAVQNVTSYGQADPMGSCLSAEDVLSSDVF